MADNNYTFRGQRDDEEVLQVLKQNVWVFAKAGFITLLLANLTIFILIMFGASGFFSYVLLIFVVVVGFEIGYKWYVWENGIYILTSQRIIKMDQQGLFHRLISEIELDQVQGVTTEVRGFIATFMNFGSVLVKTGADTVVELTSVSDPYDVQQMILEAANLLKNDLEGKLEMRDNFGGDYPKSIKKS